MWFIYGGLLAWIIGGFSVRAVQLRATSTTPWENSNITLYCSHNGTQLGNISWVLLEPGSVEKIAAVELSGNTCKTETSFLDQLKYSYSCYDGTTYSVTLISVTRDMHGDMWACIVDGDRSNEITLVVQVTVASVSVGTTTDTFTFAENSTVFLTCQTSDCLPKPTIRLLTDPQKDVRELNSTASANVIKPYVSIFQVTVDRKWNEADVWCAATNKYNETVVSEMKRLNITYLAEESRILIRSITGEFKQYQGSTVFVIEYESLALSCVAPSNPPVDLFLWKGSLGTANTSEIHINKTLRTMTGTVTCVVKNTLISSDGSSSRSGTSSASVLVEVLYSPEVKYLENKIMIEGENLTCLCEIQNGNLSDIDFKWKNPKGNYVNSAGMTLQVFAVSRDKAGIYTCIAVNKMTSTDGKVKYGTGIGQFILDVQYVSKVLQFLERNHTANNLTVSENETVRLICTIEANPVAKGSIVQTTPLYAGVRGGRNLAITKSSRYIYVSELVTTCYDAGEYTCFGSNTLYNGQTHVSSKTFTLNVNCAPRVSEFHAVEKDVYSPTDVSVTLSFTAVAYPIPNSSGYTWARRTEDTSWSDITSKNSSFIIFTDGLKSDLIIRKLKESDYGEYRIIVENNFGSSNFTFRLLASDSNKFTPGTNIPGPAVGGGIGGVIGIALIVVAVVFVSKRFKKKEIKEAEIPVEDEDHYDQLSAETRPSTEAAERPDVEAPGPEYLALEPAVTDVEVSGQEYIALEPAVTGEEHRYQLLSAETRQPPAAADRQDISLRGFYMEAPGQEYRTLQLAITSEEHKYQQLSAETRQPTDVENRPDEVASGQEYLTLHPEVTGEEHKYQQLSAETRQPTDAGERPETQKAYGNLQLKSLGSEQRSDSEDTNTDV